MNGSAHVGTDFPGSWQADPGAGGVCGPNTYTNGNPIDGTTDDALFQGEVWGNPAVCAVGGGTLEAGEYEVSLYFAEIYFGPGCPGGGGTGSRVFDIVLEGQTVLQDFDIFAGDGCAASTTESSGGPTVRTFVVDILDGTLDIELPASVNNGKISSIELHSAAAIPCGVPADCDDGDVCTDDLCVGGFCETAFNTAPCDDGVACTGGDVCSLGVCSGADTCIGGEVCDPVTALCGVPSISFSKSVLLGSSSTNPTTLQFGSDDRLYVGQQNGLIKVYTVVRIGVDDYQLTATETIDLVQQIPNHDDDGTLRLDITTRQLTGILVTGTPSAPVIYASSSDPRIGAGGSGSDLGLDTNSGMVSRLSWNGSSWVKVDLVRGLSRSEENHSVNGMQLEAATQTLYLTVGGHTNQGAPSNNFALTPEYALSAAILSIDLAAIGDTPYDLPTLDDEDRAGVSDAGDPFGGNDGKNQAILLPGGPVQVHSPGWRNAYDLLITQAGRMYTVDNGPNGGWGGVPVNEGPAGTCTNAVSEPGVTFDDSLHFVSGPGYYGGHPSPTRANTANTFNVSNPQSPVSVGNAVECDYRQPGVEDGALALFDSSTNGLAEYTASNFGGAMQGDLLAASFSNQLQRIKLDASGSVATLVEALFSSVGSTPLDVTTQGDTDPFPGTIWVANHGNGAITVYEPVDFFNCTGVYDAVLDEDGDGYVNADEIDNGTNPCSSADIPPDVDGDFVSDLNDPDDDNDGLPDTSDPFAIDPDDGMTSQLPLVLSWNNDDPNPGGLLDLGWTGLMSDGVTDYALLYDAGGMTAGGAAGVMTVDLVPDGDAFGASNDQQVGFQVGVAVGPTTGIFTLQTRILGPFAGLTPQDFQSMGLFLGTGNQDDYTKLVLDANGGAGGLQFASEVAGSFSAQPTLGLSMPGPDWVDLYLEVDPGLATVTASYEASSGGVPTGRIGVGTPLSIPAAWVNGGQALAVGVISTSSGASAFPVTWDFFQVTAQSPGSTASATLAMTSSGGINASTFGSGSFVLENTSTGGEQITQLSVDLSSAFFPDMVFDPNGTAGDLTAKCFTPDSGAATVGLVTPADPCLDPFLGLHDNGFDVMVLGFTDFQPGEVFSFSVDVDPTSIQGTTAPGPNESGSVSGLELVGSQVTVDFDQGSSHANTAYRVPGSNGGSQLTAALPLPPVPTLEIVGVPFSPATVPSAARTARVTGPAGFEVTLLVVEGGLFTAGLPGGGFDLDPFEANSALVVDEYTAALDATGSVDIPFTLSDTDPDGGIGHIVAALRDGSGLTGPVSNAFVLELVPSNCGDGVLEGGEQCDDGNTEDGDCCSSACQFETAGTICGPGDACVGSSSCDGAGACMAGTPVICDDGQFCNGPESCDIVSGCQAGTPPTLDDGVGCTVDACDEASDSVTHTPDDSACDDALFCNGAETCNAATDCEAGTPPTLDDGVACTVDSCDEAGDQVQNTPDAGACQDADPCTADSCDAIFGCVNDPIPDCTVTPVPTGGAPSWLLLALVLVATAWRTLPRPGGAPASDR